MKRPRSSWAPGIGAKVLGIVGLCLLPIAAVVVLGIVRASDSGHDAVRQAVPLAAALAVSAALAVVLVRRTVSRPLREIVAAIEALTAGDLSAEVGIRGRDEIGAVARAFRLFKRAQAREQRYRQELITAKENAELSHNRLWDSINFIRDGFAIYDTQDRLVIANEAFRQLHGAIADRVRAGASFEGLVRAGLECGMWELGGEDPDEWLRRQLAARAEGQEFETEVRFRDGRTMLRRERRMPNSEIVGIRVDVTRERLREAELKAAQKELESLVYVDQLTGLANRNAFEGDLARRIAESAGDERFALIHLDLDKFKTVNDSMGHAAGDLMLKEVGRRLAGLTMSLERSRAYRWGGDEFVIICARRGDADVEKVCGEISDLLAFPIRIDDSQVWSTASIGVARFPEDGDDIDSLMVFADLALYEAKEKGRDNYHFFTRELKERVERSKRIERELRVALDQGQLELFYQPQVRISDGAVTGVEALLRWRHPERGLLTPGMFLNVAEQTNLAVPVGRFVVETAARTARHWLDAGVRFGKLALNVSPRQLDQDSFAAEFMAALDRYGVEPSRIGVEVVESVLIDDARRRHAEVLRELHEAGVWIELDDFGTGYASLTHVTSLQVDVIKLDRSFARDLLKNPAC